MPAKKAYKATFDPETFEFTLDTPNTPDKYLVIKGNYTLQVGSEAYVFTWVEELNASMQPQRSFGIVDSQERLRIKFDGEIFIVQTESGTDITYIAVKVDDTTFMTTEIVSQSTTLDYNNLPPEIAPFNRSSSAHCQPAECA